MRNKKITPIIILAIIFYASIVFAGHKHHERYYQSIWCDQAGGETEVVMPRYQKRCDCLTCTHAIEFDFAYNWAQAIGQALHYSAETGKRAGIVLILEVEKDTKQWNCLNYTIRAKNLPIDTWAMYGWEY